MFSLALRGVSRPPMRARMHNVRSLDDRARLIRDRIEVGLRDPEMRQVAYAVSAGDAWTLADFASRNGYRPPVIAGLRPCEDRDDACELANIFGFVKENVRYVGEWTNVDTYASARHTLFAFRAGDCDDMAIACGTLAVHNGFAYVLRFVAPEDAVDPSDGAALIQHVYGVALTPKFSPQADAAVAIDPTLKGAGFADEVPRIAQVDYRVF